MADGLRGPPLSFKTPVIAQSFDDWRALTDNLRDQATAANVQPQSLRALPALPTIGGAPQERQQEELQLNAQTNGPFTRAFQQATHGTLGSTAQYGGVAANYLGGKVAEMFDSNDSLRSTANVLGLRTIGAGLNRYAEEQAAKAAMYQGPKYESDIFEAAKTGHIPEYMLASMGSGTNSILGMIAGGGGLRALSAAKYAPEVGAFLSSAVPQAGSNLQQTLQDNPNVDPGRALAAATGAGVIQGALDVAPELGVLKWATKPSLRGASFGLGQVAKRTAQAVAGGGAGEFLTGGAQDVLQQAQSQIAGNRPVQIDPREAFNSAMQEALGGAHVMAAGGAARGTAEAIGAGLANVGKAGKAAALTAYDAVPDEVKQSLWQKVKTGYRAAKDMVDTATNTVADAKAGWDRSEGLTVPARITAAGSEVVEGAKQRSNARAAKEAKLEELKNGTADSSTSADHAALVGAGHIDYEEVNRKGIAGLASFIQEKHNVDPNTVPEIRALVDEFNNAKTPEQHIALKKKIDAMTGEDPNQSLHISEHTQVAMAQSLLPMAQTLHDDGFYHSPVTAAQADGILRLANSALRRRIADIVTGVNVGGKEGEKTKGIAGEFAIKVGELIGNDQQPGLIQDLQNQLAGQLNDMARMTNKEVKRLDTKTDMFRWLERNMIDKDRWVRKNTINERKEIITDWMKRYSNGDIEGVKKEIGQVVGEAKSVLGLHVVARMTRQAFQMADPGGKPQQGVGPTEHILGMATANQQQMRDPNRSDLTRVEQATGSGAETDQAMLEQAGAHPGAVEEDEGEAEGYAPDRNWEPAQQTPFPRTTSQWARERRDFTRQLTTTGGKGVGKPDRQGYNPLAQLDTVSPQEHVMKLADEDETGTYNPDRQLNEWADTHAEQRGEALTAARDALKGKLSGEQINTAVDVLRHGYATSTNRSEFNGRRYLRDHYKGNPDFTPDVIRTITEIASHERALATHAEATTEHPETYGFHYFERHEHVIPVARNQSSEGRQLSDLRFNRGEYTVTAKDKLSTANANKRGLIKLHGAEKLFGEEGAQTLGELGHDVTTYLNIPKLMQEATPGNVPFHQLDIKQQQHALAVVFDYLNTSDALKEHWYLKDKDKDGNVIFTTPDPNAQLTKFLNALKFANPKTEASKSAKPIMKQLSAQSREILSTFFVDARMEDPKNPKKITSYTSAMDLLNADRPTVKLDGDAVKGFFVEKPSASTLLVTRNKNTANLDLEKVVQFALQQQGHDAQTGERVNKWQALSALYHGLLALKNFGIDVPSFDDPKFAELKYWQREGNEILGREADTLTLDTQKLRLLKNMPDPDSSFEKLAAQSIRDPMTIDPSGSVHRTLSLEALMSMVNNSLAELSGEKSAERNVKLGEKVGKEMKESAAKERDVNVKLVDSLLAEVNKNIKDINLKNINLADVEFMLRKYIRDFASSMTEHSNTWGRFGADSHLVDAKGEGYTLKNVGDLLAFRTYLDGELNHARIFVDDSINADKYGRTKYERPDPNAPGRFVGENEVRTHDEQGNKIEYATEADRQHEKANMWWYGDKGEKIGYVSLSDQQHVKMDKWQYGENVYSMLSALTEGNDAGAIAAIGKLKTQEDLAHAFQLASDRAASDSVMNALKKQTAAWSGKPNEVNLTDAIKGKRDVELMDKFSDAQDNGQPIVLPARVENERGELVSEWKLRIEDGDKEHVITLSDRALPQNILEGRGGLLNGHISFDTEGRAVFYTDSPRATEKITVLPKITTRTDLARRLRMADAAVRFQTGEEALPGKPGLAPKSTETFTRTPGEPLNLESGEPVPPGAGMQPAGKDTPKTKALLEKEARDEAEEELVKRGLGTTNEGKLKLGEKATGALTEKLNENIERVAPEQAVDRGKHEGLESGQTHAQKLGETWDLAFEQKMDELTGKGMSEAKARVAADKYANEMVSTNQSLGTGPVADIAKEYQAAKDRIAHLLGSDSTDVTLDPNLTSAGEASKTKNKNDKWSINLGLSLADGNRVGSHESMHVLMSMLREMSVAGNKDARRIMDTLDKAMSTQFVKNQILKFFKGHPNIEGIKDALKNKPEEAITYGFELWAHGKLKIGPQTKTMFEKIATTVLRWLHMSDAATTAENFFKFFHEGKLAAREFKPNALVEAMGLQRGDVLAERTRQMMGPMLDMVRHVFGDLGAQITHIAKANKIPVLNEIRDLYTKVGSGYLWRVGTESRKHAAPFVDLLEDLVHKHGNAKAHELMEKGLQEVRSKNITSAEGKQLQQMIRSINEYAGRKDLDYVPQIFDHSYIARNRDQLETDLRQYGTMKSTGTAFKDMLFNIMNDYGVQGVHREGDWQIAFDPKHMDVAEKYFQKDPNSWMRQFIMSSVKKTEHAKIFGEYKIDKDTGVREPFPEKLKQLMYNAEAAGLGDNRRHVVRFIDAAEGRLGRELSPSIREFMKNAAIGMNVLMLPLSLFSAFVEPMAIAARSNNLMEAMQAYGKGFKSIADTIGSVWGDKREKSEVEKFSNEIGITEHAILVDALGDVWTGEQAYGKGKKINDWFFKWNMLDGWSRAMRVAATESSINFIAEHGKASKWKDAKNDQAFRFMEQLGLQKGDVRFNKDGSLALGRRHDPTMTAEQEERLHRAVNIFVDESAIRPNPATGALWMSDPRFMWLSHMKRFTWAFDKLVLQRAFKEVAAGNPVPYMILMASAPVAAASTIMREMIKPGAANWMANMDWMDWAAFSQAKAGLAGRAQYPIDMLSAPIYGTQQALGPVLGNILSTLQTAKTKGMLAAVMKNIPGYQLLSQGTSFASDEPRNKAGGLAQAIDLVV